MLAIPEDSLVSAEVIAFEAALLPLSCCFQDACCVHQLWSCCQKESEETLTSFVLVGYLRAPVSQASRRRLILRVDRQRFYHPLTMSGRWCRRPHSNSAPKRQIEGGSSLAA